EPDSDQSTSQTPQSAGLNTDHTPNQTLPRETEAPSIVARSDWPMNFPPKSIEHTPGLTSEESTVTAVSSIGGAVEPNIESSETTSSSLNLDTRTPTIPQINIPSLAMAPKGYLHPPLAGVSQSTTGDRSASNASEISTGSSQPDFARAFRMVIHLPGDRSAQRMTCLDTCADMDAISRDVVETLKLKTESYSGGTIKPLGPPTNSFKPERQVTLDWHVATFNKTYTTTFAVFNEEHSDEFDVLLGLETIERIGFYKKNRNIWLSSSRGEVCLSEDIVE
ncbi:MAG: hypothetical protein Q9226_008692, partial [Calogaya cf. arnoldii]